jgi:hypothetical protein
VSDRDRGRGAELRAERIQRRVRSRTLSQASRHMDEHLRQMDEEASLLDKRLRRHGRGQRELAQEVGRPLLS